MRSRILCTLSVFVLLILGLLSPVSAQTTTTGAIIGSVTDVSGAVVPGVEVALQNNATGQVSKATTNADGKYFFPSVPPGAYTISLTKEGFRKISITDIQIEVTKTNTYNTTLEVGSLSQTVEITGTGVAELQTVDSTVGNVVSGKVLPLLPALSRQANELLNYQPMTTPGGAVAGSREDQSTFTLDGIDVTNNSVGGTGTYMRLPIDGVDEFRVGVANANASFGRGGGGQAAIISKRGSSDFHGAAYWYHQNDNLNAASWTNKRTLGQTITDPVRRAKTQKPEFKDNRFGFNVGGPILPFKEKLFFFLNYEGQRNPRNTSFLRLVPSDSLRQGILRFRDGAGNIVNYNLKTSSLCGPTGNQACDPRALGLSPSISALWAKLPAGNDPSSGDGLNTLGYRGNVANPLNNDYYAARFDYNLSDNWRFDGSFRYFGELAQGSGLLDIQGGDAISREQFPNRQNFISAGITGTISPTLTGEFRFGWVRSRTATDRFRPNQTAALLAIPGTNTSAGYIALDIGAVGGTESLLSEPINVGTQVARKQASDNKNFQYNADMTWLKGDHTFQFGGHVRYLPTFHLRDDKVVGSLGALVAQIDSDLGGGVAIPAASRPPTCGAGVTTNCLASGDVQQWNRLMAGALGLIDNISVLAVRDASFKPLPFGEVLVADTTLWAPEFYFQDVWRLNPSLTLTYGLNYGWQTPPKEKQNRFTVQVDGLTLQPQTAKQYLTAREAAAAQGNIYNPQIAFLPVDVAKRDVFNIDWNNVGPRGSIAWNPSYSKGFLGKVFGEKKTVLRGGYSLVFDRQNTVQSVIIPTLGVAFGQTINVTGPRCNATGAGGPLCDSANANPVLGGYRVGQDGTIPLPTVPTQTIPASPYWGILPGSSGPPYAASALRLFPEVLSFQVDPEIQVGKNHSFNFTWQRELPGNFMIEVGYVGRKADQLTQSMSFGQVPYNFLDKASGQTFAQAFDALAIQMRGGTAAGSVALQPWFENLVPGGTRAVAAAQGANIINGNINNVFLDLDRRRMLNGLQPFNNYMAQTLFLRASVGASNYNAFFLTLEKHLSKGLLFTVNYTLSKSMDQFGAIQNAASVMPNNFNLDAEYGPSPFDNRHLFNATGVYELPFGKGRRFNPGNTILDKIIGGWYSSGILTARSGDPLVVTQGPGVWGGSLFLGFTSGAIPTKSISSFEASLNDNVNGSNNIGTNGNPANRGTALNLFSNPEQVFNSFRRVEISRDGRAGRANPIYGLPRWNVDLSFGKKTSIAEKVNVTFLFDFINVFNIVNFNNPSLSLTDPRGFGVVTSQNGNPRQIQFGMRVEF